DEDRAEDRRHQERRDAIVGRLAADPGRDLDWGGGGGLAGPAAGRLGGTHGLGPPAVAGPAPPGPSGAAGARPSSSRSGGLMALSQSRQRAAASFRCWGVEGLGGPRPSILRLMTWRPCREAATTSSSASVSASMSAGTTSMSLVWASAQAARRRRPGS